MLLHEQNRKLAIKFMDRSACYIILFTINTLFFGVFLIRMSCFMFIPFFFPFPFHDQKIDSKKHTVQMLGY